MSYKKLHFLSIIFAITMILSIDNHCFAQNIYANGSIDRDSIFAGQPFNYKLEVKAPNDYIIDWTDTKDTLSNSIEVVRISDITKTEVGGNEVILTQTLTLTSFDTGYIEIPRIGVKYSESTSDTAKQMCFTKYMDIYVEPISIDTTAAYKPIIMPIKQNITVGETFPYLAGAIVLAGLIFLAIYLIKRSKKKVYIEEEEIKPQIPPIITAREKLTQLKESNLWQSGKSKEYYTDLTDIVREYLEGQFNIDAIEMTSDEILNEVKTLQMDKLIFNKLEHTLITADLVKFAKANPDSSQNETSFNDIYSFVEESYEFHQEMEKKKTEEAKARKYDFEKETTENQEMEETK
mgnify:FL=1